jgi:predicted GIY-YIG superfamily endonuclease
MTEQDVTSSPIALYRLYGTTGELLYVGLTDNLGARLDEHAKSKPWWGEVTRRTAEWLPSRIEARKAEAAAILHEEPRYNLMRPRQGRPSRPPKPDRHREKPLSLRLGAERQRLDDYARATGQPVRRVIADAVKAWLDKQQQDAGSTP